MGRVGFLSLDSSSVWVHKVEGPGALDFLLPQPSCPDVRAE